MANRIGRKKVLVVGLATATLADILFFLGGNILGVTIAGVALLGLGTMVAHSTLLTIATEFAARARGAAMSLVAFFFMGGGGVGTAIGGRLINGFGYQNFFSYYGIALLVLTVLAGFQVRTEMNTAVGPKAMVSQQ